MGQQAVDKFPSIMSYSLRRYGLGQADKLARFVVPIASRTYARWADPDSAGRWAAAEHGVPAWKTRLDDPATHVLVYERPDASIAACGFIRLSRDTAYLGGLYVEDVGCGLGRRLLAERLRIGRDFGAQTAVMLIRETNAAARVLAEKAGFEAIEEDPCGRLSAVRRLVYRRPLAAPVPVPA
jgi:L-amino acid N-acyltransferase YncA